MIRPFPGTGYSQGTLNYLVLAFLPMASGRLCFCLWIKNINLYHGLAKEKRPGNWRRGALAFISSAVMAFFTLAHPFFEYSGQGVMKPAGLRSWYHENAGWADFSGHSHDSFLSLILALFALNMGIC